MSQQEDIHTRLAKLSAGQQDCLRLVNIHLTSKEIAIKLEISRFTVNQRIERACKTLGVLNRKDAARLFAVYDPILHEPFDIADLGISSPAFPDVDQRESGNDPSSEFILQDIHQPFVTNSMVPGQWNALPFPRKRGDANDLSIKARLVWAALIACAGIMISGLLIAALETLGRLLH